MKKEDKRIYKSDNDYIITGVCGGIADMLEIDSFMVRLVFVLLTFVNGIGILLYLILFFLMPSRHKKEKIEINEKKINEFSEEVRVRIQGLKNNKGAENNLKNIFGIVVVLVGVLMILKSYLGVDLVSLFFPVLVIILGIYILVKS